MTKSELVANIAKDTGLTKADTDRVVRSFVENVTKALKKGDDVALVGFGTFSVTKRKARMGLNPQTGEALKIPAAKVAKFKAGKNLKDTVNNKRR